MCSQGPEGTRDGDEVRDMGYVKEGHQDLGDEGGDGGEGILGRGGGGRIRHC